MSLLEHRRPEARDDSTGCVYQFPGLIDALQDSMTLDYSVLYAVTTVYAVTC